jgi:glutathione S-transferase
MSNNDHTDQAGAGGGDRLSLYYSPICGFCTRVIRTLEQLGVDAELRNTLQDPDFYNELVDARGRATVPVLRIESADGGDHWMPESSDIIRYLQKRFG